MSDLSTTDWRNLVRRIRTGKLLPIIGDQVTGRLLYDNQELIQAWADDIGYPMGRSFSLTRLAQYLSVEGGEALAAKEEYLGFLKRHYLKSYSKTGHGQEVADLKGELHGMRLSELVGRLNQAILDDELSNPLRRLAQLPAKIYLTTTYHNFLEQTLRSLGKEPRVEICFWDHNLKAPVTSSQRFNPLAELTDALNERFSLEELNDLAFRLNIESEDLPGQGPMAKARGLVETLNRQDRLPDLVHLCQERREMVAWAMLAGLSGEDESAGQTLPSVFETDPLYKPSTEQPLVYHLHGLDICPPSMVLTEDDYFDFLVAVSADDNIIPPPVKQALADSSLLLLGYDLQDWAFRILFRGLIAQRLAALPRVSVAIQLTPLDDGAEQPGEIEGARNYLEKYFSQDNFVIYWGSSRQFVQDLWRQWEDAL